MILNVKEQQHNRKLLLSFLLGDNWLIGRQQSHKDWPYHDVSSQNCLAEPLLMPGTIIPLFYGELLEIIPKLPIFDHES